MDLHAKSKKDGEHEETISVGDKTEDDIVSQTVIENTQTGGFDFLNPNSTIEEMPSEENTEEDTSSEENQTGIQAAKEGAEEQPDESNNDLVIPNPSDETTEQDNSVDVISQADFLEEDSLNEDNDELFDESQAFDPALAQPQYGVSSIVGGSKDTEIEKRIESVKQKLMEIDTQGGLINPFKFVDEMKTEDSRKQSNIEHKDEYTKY